VVGGSFCEITGSAVPHSTWTPILAHEPYFFAGSGKGHSTFLRPPVVIGTPDLPNLSMASPCQGKDFPRSVPRARYWRVHGSGGYGRTGQLGVDEISTPVSRFSRGAQDSREAERSFLRESSSALGFRMRFHRAERLHREPRGERNPRPVTCVASRRGCGALILVVGSQSAEAKAGGLMDPEAIRSPTYTPAA
jgi:hypothetical protein